MHQIKLQNGIPATIKTFLDAPTFVIEQVLTHDFEIEECTLVFSGQAISKEVKIKLGRIVNKFVLVPKVDSPLFKIEFPTLELKVVAHYNDTGEVSLNYRFE